MTEGPAVSLEVRNLTAGYQDLRAVWDLSLTVEPGKIVVLLGRNGAGKTTTLHAIAGLLPDTTGEVRLGGRDVSRLPAYERVRLGMSLVQEGKRIFRRLTVEDNLRIGAAAVARRGAAAGSALARSYSLFPMLAEHRRVLAGALSGGQQEMLAIAQALCACPGILLLDEPSAGLAPIVVRELFEAIDQLRREGMGILLVEQLAEQAVPLADEVVVLESGRVASRRAGPVPPHQGLGDTPR